MAGKSNIEWTEVTWNPVTGCSKISTGCKNCYAEKMAIRLRAMGIKQYRNGFKLTLAPHSLNLPYTWKSKKVVFVNSMSDLFHEEVPISYIRRVFKVMNETNHIFQLLTKRPERLKEINNKLEWSNNIWFGVSVEKNSFIHRIEMLKHSKAKVKFVSLEPLLGRIADFNPDGIDWVITGGESGTGARPIEKAWVMEIKSICRRTGTPFFFKQWGKKEFNVNKNDPTIESNHLNHAKGGCQLNGMVYREMPKQLAFI
jgi:protein gp37